jgi:hypothetical protein
MQSLKKLTIDCVHLLSFDQCIILTDIIKYGKKLVNKFYNIHKLYIEHAREFIVIESDLITG